MGPSMSPFRLVYSSLAISKKKKKNVLPPCSSGKCHAILPRVGGNAATAVVKEEPQLTNQREARPSFFGRIDVQTIDLENETERKETIKCNR